jgi:hypothetical protein
LTPLGSVPPIFCTLTHVGPACQCLLAAMQGRACKRVLTSWRATPSGFARISSGSAQICKARLC